MNDIHNCATATITVVITEIPILPVVARDDAYTVTIGTTTITESIYHNDSRGDQMVDASLVNTMLDNAIQLLAPDEKPIVHSDRGAHYRWPG